jgi:DNA-binding transcriptional ArsR family regulator
MAMFGRDELSEALAAVAHPVRRDLLSLMRDGPARVTDLAARFDISLPAISRHLRVLEAAGFVARRIAGRDHFIEVRPDGLREVVTWVERQSAEWGERLVVLRQMMEAGDG